MASQTELIPVSIAFIGKDYFYFPGSGWHASPSRSTTSIKLKYTGTHLYTCVERSTMRVTLVLHKNTTQHSSEARTPTARFKVQRTNHYAAAPPTAINETLSLVATCDYRFCYALGRVCQPRDSATY